MTTWTTTISHRTRRSERPSDSKSAECSWSHESIRGTAPSGEQTLFSAASDWKHSAGQHAAGAAVIVADEFDGAILGYVFAYEDDASLADSTAASGRRVAFSLHEASSAPQHANALLVLSWGSYGGAATPYCWVTATTRAADGAVAGTPASDRAATKPLRFKR